MHRYPKPISTNSLLTLLAQINSQPDLDENIPDQFTPDTSANGELAAS